MLSAGGCTEEADLSPDDSLQDGSDPTEAHQVDIPSPAVHSEQTVGQEEECGGEEHEPPANTLQ